VPSDNKNYTIGNFLSWLKGHNNNSSNNNEAKDSKHSELSGRQLGRSAYFSKFGLFFCCCWLPSKKDYNVIANAVVAVSLAC